MGKINFALDKHFPEHKRFRRSVTFLKSNWKQQRNDKVHDTLE